MGDVIDNPNLADVCPDCNGEQTVVELIPGHSPDCFTNGKCVDECPIPYEMEISCPTCQGDGTVDDIDSLPLW
jgi:DnaJ-class molecular chaperone